MGERNVELNVEQSAGVIVISVAMPRVSADASDEFEEAVVRAIGELKGPKVLIDFDGVEFISSSVLGKLIKLNDTIVASRRGQLKLSSLARKIAEVFKITGLERLFSIHKTKDGALGSFE